MTMRSVVTYIAMFTLSSGPTFAGGCEMGPAALNLIRTASPSIRSVDEPKDFTMMNELGWKVDTLGISFAIDWAADWRKMWAWKRNLIGLVSSDRVNSVNQMSDEAGLNKRVWHASPIDSDEILSAKMNVIKAALFANSRGLYYQGATSTNQIQAVSAANSEEAAFDILAHTYVAENRKKRQYNYWHSVQKTLSSRFIGYFSSVSIHQIKLAFDKDHPSANDVADVVSLRKLMMTRLPSGESLFLKAATGDLDRSAVGQLTGRPNLGYYFSGSCENATR